jgi:hypothetical protein
MSRDHYKGIPKKRVVLLNSDGDLEALEKGGEAKSIKGTATLTAGTVTVNDTRFVSGATAYVSGKHPYPITDGFNWDVGDGYLTISGSAADTYTVSWEVSLP